MKLISNQYILNFKFSFDVKQNMSYIYFFAQVGIALFSSGSFKNCLGNVVIKADSSASRRTSTAVHGQLDSSLEAGKPPLNMQRTNRRRYSLMVMFSHLISY